MATGPQTRQSRLRGVRDLSICSALGILVCSALVWQSTYAGTSGILEGSVKDLRTGEPIPGIVIELRALKRGAVSDVEGKFEFQNVPAGTYEVRLSHVGYRTLVVKGVVVNADLRTRVAKSLEPAEIPLDEVEVFQETPLVRQDVTSTSYFVSSAELNDLPLTTPTEIIGLKAGTTLEGNVRGGKISEVSYFVDGLAVQDLMGGGLGLKLPTGAVVGLSFYAGGFEAEYGNSLSGVVNMVTRTGTNTHQMVLRASTDDLLGGTQVSREREIEVSASGPVLRDRLFYTVSIDGIFSGTRWWQDFDRFYGGPHDRQISGFGKLEYLFSPTMRLNAQVLFYHHDWYDYDFIWRLNLDGLPPEHKTSYRLAAILSHSVSSRFYYNLIFSHYVARTRVGDSVREEVPANDPFQYDFFLQYVISGKEALWSRLGQHTTTVKFDGTWKPAADHLMKMGGELNLNSLSSDILKFQPQMTYFGRPLVDRPQIDFSSSYAYAPSSGGVYFSDKIDVMEKDGSLLNLGARFDFLDPRAHRPSINAVLAGDTLRSTAAIPFVPSQWKYRFSPRVGLGIQMTENSYCFFNLGFYFQNPLFDYMYTGIDRVALNRGFSALTGNPDLEPERSTQWEVSVRYALPMGIVASAVYFKKETSNLIDVQTFVTGDSKIAGTFGFAQFVNVPEARASGVEIGVGRERGKWLTGEVSYTYMVTEANSGSAFDAFYFSQYGFKPYIRTFPLSWDQKHTVKATLMYASDNGYHLDLVAHWHSGRPYTDYPTTTGFFPVRGGDFLPNNARMPDYFNVDIKVRKRFVLPWWADAGLDVYLDIRNLTNEFNTLWMDSNGREGGELGDPSGHTMGRRVRYGVQVSF